MTHSGTHPGETCPSCKRRVPYPKKPSSPKETHPLSFGRAPVEVVDELKDRVNTVADLVGFTKWPYPQARAVMLMLTIAEAVNIETLVEVASGMSWGTAEKEPDPAVNGVQT